MSWLRPRHALLGGAIVLAAAAVVPAGASPAAPPRGLKTFHVAVPLPKAHKGRIALVVVRVKIPSNMRVSGNIVLLSATNGDRLPCYLRAAGITIQERTQGLWHVFVPINAPKGLVQCRIPAASTSGAAGASLGLSVQIPPPVGSEPATVKEQPGDACKLLKQEEHDRHVHESGQSLLGSSPWREIEHRAENDDSLCG